MKESKTITLIEVIQAPTVIVFCGGLKHGAPCRSPMKKTTKAYWGLYRGSKGKDKREGARSPAERMRASKRKVKCVVYTWCTNLGLEHWFERGASVLRIL